MRNSFENSRKSGVAFDGQSKGGVFRTRGTVCEKHLPFILCHRIAIFIQPLVNRRLMMNSLKMGGVPARANTPYIADA